jgi:hypothetical protein
MQRDSFIVSKPFDFFPVTPVGTSPLQPIEQLKEKDCICYGLLLPMASFITNKLYGAEHYSRGH